MAMKSDSSFSSGSELEGTRLPGERAAADGILAECGGLAVADVANGDAWLVLAEASLEAGADREVVPELAIEVGSAEQDAVHGGRAGGGEADGGDIGERDAEVLGRGEGGGDDRRDRALGAFFGRGGKLIGDVDDFTLVVADREGAGGSADVDAEVVGQWRCLVWRRWWPFCVDQCGAIIEDGAAGWQGQCLWYDWFLVTGNAGPLIAAKHRHGGERVCGG